MPHKDPVRRKEYYDQYISDPKKQDKHDRQRRDNDKARYTEARTFVDAQKKKSVCIECGHSDYRVLDFHHLDPGKKTVGVSRAVVQRWSAERILAEISKCVVLCANCHRLLHWSERTNNEPKTKRQRRRCRIRKFIESCRLGQKCTQCGEDDFRVLDFHHTDPSTKDGTLANALALNWGSKRILEEITKCTVLCANCHRIAHCD